MLYLADIWLIGLFLVKNYHKIDLGFVLWQFIIFKYFNSGPVEVTKRNSV